ncbi:MAG: hypothetical protein Q9221_003302 [Calogaya cf. arnoldii]
MAGVDTFTRYGQSKTANILFASELARRYPSITCVSCHPGVIETKLGTPSKTGNGIKGNIFGLVLKVISVPLSEGAKNQLRCATGKGVVSGRFYYPVGAVDGGRGFPDNKTLGKKLWDWTENELAQQGNRVQFSNGQSDCSNPTNETFSAPPPANLSTGYLSTASSSAVSSSSRASATTFIEPSKFAVPSPPISTSAIPQAGDNIKTSSRETGGRLTASDKIALVVTIPGTLATIVGAYFTYVAYRAREKRKKMSLIPVSSGRPPRPPPRPPRP